MIDAIAKVVGGGASSYCRFRLADRITLASALVIMAFISSRSYDTIQRDRPIMRQLRTDR